MKYMWKQIEKVAEYLHRSVLRRNDKQWTENLLTGLRHCSNIFTAHCFDFESRLRVPSIFKRFSAHGWVSLSHSQVSRSASSLGFCHKIHTLASLLVTVLVFINQKLCPLGVSVGEKNRWRELCEIMKCVYRFVYLIHLHEFAFHFTWIWL